MIFAEHSELVDKHALLGASKYYWLNYTDDKLVSTYNNLLKKEEGIRLHKFASDAINNKIKLASIQKALNKFVNDAIGFRMSSEVVLYYSDNCFGTADAIVFNKNILRIHDFKSGVSIASFKQLKIYAALFCLEYRINPKDIQIILRIYQYDNFEELLQESDEIEEVMNRIVYSDKLIDSIK